MQEFLTAFEDADTLEVLDIYAASEEPIAGITAGVLVEGMKHPQAHYAATPEEAIHRAVANAGPGDAILTLGAGNVSQLAPFVLDKLKSNIG
jgi:UDP-N-acetylmuramate--alanine ligase